MGTGRVAEYPDVVLLMAGTNDYFSSDPADTEANLTGIIDWFATNRPSAVVLVASPPPANGISSYGPGIEAIVSNENTWLQANIAQFPNARYVDVYDTFLNPDGSINNNLLTTIDGVHPDLAGYQVIANDCDVAISQLVSSDRVFNNSSGTTTFQTDTNIGTSKLLVNVLGGTVVFGSSQHLAGLNVSNGALVQVSATTVGNRSVIITPSLAVTGVLDLANNDLDVSGGCMATVESLVQSGYNGGNWGGSGIISTSAAADTTHLTALGVIINDATANATGSLSDAALYSALDGVPVADGDILVKYAYYGDTNLDGTVDGSDYSRIDNGYLMGLTGWANGDFNYDGVINGSDYTLIDNAYNQQGASLAAELPSSASLTSEIAVSPVPEPTTAVAMLAGGASALRRRSRRSTINQEAKMQPPRSRRRASSALG
jgi:hypothetical protein